LKKQTDGGKATMSTLYGKNIQDRRNNLDKDIRKERVLPVQT
jgi:hypothetical protein